MLEDVVVEPKRGEVEAAIAWIENTDDNFFAARGWENGNTLFDTAEFGVGRGMTFLRQAGLIRDEIGRSL